MPSSSWSKSASSQCEQILADSGKGSGLGPTSPEQLLTGTQAVVIIVEVYEGMLKFILVVLTTKINFNIEEAKATLFTPVLL